MLENDDNARQKHKIAGHYYGATRKIYKQGEDGKNGRETIDISRNVSIRAESDFTVS